MTRSLRLLIAFAALMQGQLFAQVIPSDWAVKGAYPGGRVDDGTGAMFEDFLYMGTGIDASFTLRKDWWRYSPESDEWLRCAPIPGEARQYAVAFSSERFIYLAGGILQGNEVSAACFRYDPHTDQWSALPNAPWQPRGSMAVFAIGNYVYLAGGRNDSVHFNDLWQFDTESETWQQLGDLPFGEGRDEHVGFAHAGYGYLMLGRSKGALHVDVWQYDPLVDDWLAKEPFPGEARSYAMAAATSFGGVVVGGQSDNGQITQQGYYYLPENDQWIALPNLPIPLRGAHLFSTQTSVLTFGGLSTNFSRAESLYELPLAHIETSNLEVLIFPNPSAGFVQFKSSNFAAENEPLDYMVLDAAGRVVAEGKASYVGGLLQADLGYLQSGSYFLKLRSTRGSVLESLVIIK